MHTIFNRSLHLILLSSIITLPLGAAAKDILITGKNLPTNIESKYPNFESNAALTQRMQDKIRPYLLPLNHPIKARLDALFKTRVTKDSSTLAKAGFVTISERPFTFAIIAKHPSFPGYIFKLYLDSEKRKKQHKAGWEWLVSRCQGAENVRKLIHDKKLRHFSVPDKWLYPLPYTAEAGKEAHPIILIATDMDLASREQCELAWKSATRSQVEELYQIISHGYASSYLIDNIPLTKSGKFSCIDTEHPKRDPSFNSARRFLSSAMRSYWDSLVSKYKGKTR